MKMTQINFKQLKRCIAVVMCMIMAISAPLQTFAASNKKQYISDLKIAYGNSADEAKNWLAEEGYQVLDHDLNSVDLGIIDNIFADQRAVYLGYKATDDPTEAIRDLKTMNMNGGYSFQDYQEMLESEKNEINAFMEDFHLTLNEYRENYKNGVSRALLAHDTLNKIYEDDTQQYLGDLLLHETKQEMDPDVYEALSEAEKKDHADMVTVLMQGNSQIILAVEQNLYLGADTDQDNTFLDRLADLECYEDFEKEFKSGFPKSTSITEIDKKMDIAYGDAASMIGDKLEDFRKTMSIYTEISELEGVEDPEKIEEYFKDTEHPMDYIIWNNVRSLYNRLHEIPYEDGTMYDFLLGEEYDLTGED